LSSRPATLIGLVLALIGPGMIALWTKRLGSTLLPLSLRATGLLAFVILVGAVLTIALWVEKLSWSEIGFGRVSWRSPLWAVALAVLLVFVYGPIATAALARFGGTFRMGASSLAGLPRWYPASAIVIVAAGQEWLYRGYALERLQVLTGSI
jgi:hypothetical protein